MGFWDFFWLMIWGFFFLLYLMVLFQIVVDIFRDSSLSGGAKALWIVGLFILPAITALIYLIVRGRTMNEREVNARKAAQAASEEYLRSVVGSAPDPATQIANAKALLEAGTITEAEYAQLKAKALA
jgi:hypothetical protein